MRVSATTLESFRRVLAGFKPEEELIASLTGQFVPTRRIQIGSAFDAVLESIALGRYSPAGDVVTSGGFSFLKSEVRESVLPFVRAGGLPQVKARRPFLIDDEVWNLTAKLDRVVGLTIDEFKTTKTFDFDTYYESMQWPCYLAVFEGSTSVRYTVFEVEESGEDPGLVNIEAAHRFSLYPWAGLDQLCASAIREFAWWAAARGMYPYLLDKED